MGLHIIHLITHDGVAIREDGPIHQPVKQLASQQAIPDLIGSRHGEANETAVACRAELETQKCPLRLVLTRQAVAAAALLRLNRGEIPACMAIGQCSIANIQASVRWT